MKDILLIGIVLFIIVALFGDGGLEISPTLSPSLDAAMDFAPQLDVNYAPDRSVTTTTIEQQVNNYIERQVEHETVIVNPVPATIGTNAGSNGGVALVDGRPDGQCFTVPGDVVVMQGSNGECQVVNAGQRYFVAPAGTRSWLRGQSDEPTALVQQTQPQAPAITTDGRLSAMVPLDEITTEQLQAAFIRNGGKLPALFGLWRDASKRDWLASRTQTWQ